MSTIGTGCASPQLRASDADRDAVLTQLTENFQAGRLTSDEFDERSGQALAARTVGELDALLTDLPAARLTGAEPVVSSPQPPAAGRRSPLWPGFVPVAVVVAVVAVAATILGNPGHHHGWDFWWVVPVVVIIARRAARHRQIDAGRGDSGQDRRLTGRDW